jgi:MFS family permease
MSKSSVISGSCPQAGFRSQRLLVALYLIVTFLYFMALYLYVPTLPTHVARNSGNLALVGVILAQYGLWQAIIRLPLGIATDWLGHRKLFIMAGIALAGIGAWVMGSANGASGLFIGRAITGLAAGTWVPLTVVFSSLFPAQAAIRATAILSFVGSTGQVAATSITGSLNEFGGYSLAFFLAAGVSALAMLLMLPVRESPHPLRRPSVAGIGRLITRRDVLLPSLLAAVSQYANWAITFGFMAILAQGLGATDVMLSLLISMHIGIVTVTTLGAAGLVQHIGARHLAFLAFLLMSIGIALPALIPTLYLVFLGQFLMAIAQGISYPVLMGMSIRDVVDTERNTAMGLHQSVYAIGMFTGPWLSGFLADTIGIRSMFGMTAFACLAAASILIRLLPSRKQ